MGNPIVQIVIGLCFLLIAWYCVERFSPDALITKICQILIFILAILLVVAKVLPLVGVSI